MTPAMNIAIQEIKAFLPTGLQLEPCLRAAMDYAKDHWLVTDPDQRFRSAVGATMLYFGVDSTEFKRIEPEMKALIKFSAGLTAMHAGVEVNVSNILPAEGEIPEPIGLMKIWRETTGC